MVQDEDGTLDQDGNGRGPAEAALSALQNNKGIVVPAVLGVAAAVAAAKGPEIVRGLSSGLQEKGEEEAKRVGQKAVEGAKDGLGGRAGSGLAGKVLSKAVGAGKESGGAKKTRRLPIQRWTDVAVPVEQAYEAWTKFDEYPQFMHRVLSVEQKGEDKLSWQEKIWFSRRQWEGRITEQRKNDRIAWKTTSGMSHKGIVSFHKLDTRLTRVMVDMDFEPSGMIEKMASGMRFVKRAVQADLARFKAHVEMQEAKGIDYRHDDSDQQQDKGSAEATKSQGADRGRQERSKPKSPAKQVGERTSGARKKSTKADGGADADD